MHTALRQPSPLSSLSDVPGILTPRYLSVARQDVDGAWAGGRGFKKQPYLTVADAGGGTITMDSITMVTATVTPSLMVRPHSHGGAERIIY